MGALDVQDEIIAEVDRGGLTGFGQERECNEENNEQTGTLSDSGATPDLSVELVSAEVTFCPEVTLVFNVTNQGQGEVAGFEVGLYLGDASQGGTRIDTLIVEDPLAPGATVNLTWESQRFPSYRTAGVTLSVDPRNVIVECDDSNNTSAASELLTCEVRDGQ
jgi:subtilase family serine protease